MQEEEEREGVEQARMENNSSQDDKALNEMNISTAKEAQQLARARAVENKEQLCELSRALAVLSSASVRIGCLNFKTFSCYNLVNCYYFCVIPTNEHASSLMLLLSFTLIAVCKYRA